MEPVTVLLVDNNLTFLRIATRFLESEDWIKIQACASSGQEALEIAPTLKPDVILLDLNMPGLGGLDALPRLRRLLPGTRIIALTLLDTDGYREAAFDAGAHGFVPKALMNEELIPSILAVLKKYRQNGEPGGVDSNGTAPSDSNPDGGNDQ